MSRHPCPQCGAEKVRHVSFRGIDYGSCRACAVVLRWTGPGWRVLTEREWKRKPNLAIDLIRTMHRRDSR